MLNIPPKAAVKTLVTIVAHDEVRLIRYRDRPKVVSGVYRTINDSGINSLSIGCVIKWLVVHIYCFIANQDRLSGKANDALDELLRFVFRELKHDDISSLKDPPVPGD